MPKKRSKRIARTTAQPAEDSVGALTPTDFITVPQPLKLCRLCESKDGPFLNIFEADKVTAKKIEELMPFGVAENDDLPHKICFRCSAKVEELHEFIQKCIKTQINLRTALGKKEPFTTISKSRWEESLNQSKVSNDDICDALIKKAMKGIKDIPVNSVPLENCKDAVEPDLSAGKPGTETVKKNSSASLQSDNSKLLESSEEIILIESDDNAGDEPQRNEKLDRLSEDNSEAKQSTKQKKGVKPVIISNRTLRSKTGKVSNGDELPTKAKATGKRRISDSIASLNPKTMSKRRKSETSLDVSDKNIKEKKNKHANQSDQKVCDQSTPNKQASDKKPFEIMDHVAEIKVNGVGILFQCKMCNRNFLKKDVVQFHSCAKNQCVSKDDIIKKPNNPEPPKPPTVKYIDTRLGSDSTKLATPDTFNSNNKTSTDLQTSPVTEGTQMKPKPRIGPASKVKRSTEESTTSLVTTKIGVEAPSGKNQTVTSGSLNLAPTPNLNCPYKLIPGPNNTYTLVEEPVAQELGTKTQIETKLEKRKPRQSVNDSNITVGNSNCLLLGSKQTEATKQTVDKQPYPVGLIQTVPKFPLQSLVPQTINSRIFAVTEAQKQSCSIIQTEHPNKFIISPKPQPSADESVKKTRKTKSATPQQKSESAKPFSFTLDDTSDEHMFNILNVDPLLTPAYVLPIADASQSVATINDRPDAVTHLTAGNKYYTCNMCNKVFTREQKLLAHIHSHYNRMDEEDQIRVTKTTRKRGKKIIE